MQNTLRMP